MALYVMSKLAFAMDLEQVIISLKLKTLISKYLHNSKKLYVSFIDLRKAFDSVLHPALFIKLVSCGLGGNFLSVLRAMYSKIDLQVICNSRGLTEVFPSQLGVFQGDNLSPNLFIYL